MITSVFPTHLASDSLKENNRSQLLPALFQTVFAGALLLFLGACSERKEQDFPNQFLREVKEAKYNTKPLSNQPLLPTKPKSVTLLGAYTLQEALRILQKQSEYNLSISGPEPANKKDFDLDDVPFWTAAVTVRNKFRYALENFGGTIVFSRIEGLIDHGGYGRFVERAPAQIRGPFLISRNIRIRSYPENTIRQYVNTLKPSRKKRDRLYAHRILKRISQKSLPLDYARWNTWMKRKKYAPQTPLEITHSGDISLEFWAEPALDLYPMFTKPELTVVDSKGNSYDDPHLSKRKSQSNQWEWKVSPPLQSLKHQPVTLKGTIFPAIPDRKQPLNVPVQKTFTRVKMESLPITEFHPLLWTPGMETKSNGDLSATILGTWKTNQGWYYLLEIERNTTLAPGERKKLIKMYNQIENRSTDSLEISKPDYKWYRKQLKKHFQSYPEVTLKMSKNDQEKTLSGKIISHKQPDFFSTYYFVSTGIPPSNSSLQLRISLHTKIREIPVSFELSPLYFYNTSEEE